VLSVVALGTAVDRGGTMGRRIGRLAGDYAWLFHLKKRSFLRQFDFP
jgi:hypothetical protein